MTNLGKRREPARSRSGETLGFRPLYEQVRALLVQRIADGIWKPGDMLPAEADIAADLGVSQGTVRKALDEMAIERFVVRRQGRGTFVASHDEARILFQFFKLVPDSGVACFPESEVIDVEASQADERSLQVLGLRQGSHVVRIRRLRSLASHVCILEQIVLPRSLFPGIEKRELPNNLYELYRAEFGVTIVRATERLKAVCASRQEAKLLAIAPGTPLLSVDRMAVAIDRRIAEWRISLCLTSAAHYLADLK